jgi:chromosomal replication initiation ATPase DnaA
MTTSQQDIDRIVAKCAKFFGVSIEDIYGRKRWREVVAARHSAWAILNYRGVRCSELARKFKRDHTTILHGVDMGAGHPLNKIMEVVL